MTAEGEAPAPAATLLSILSCPSAPTTALRDSLKEWNDDIEATNFGHGLAGDGGTAGELQLLLADVPPASVALRDVLLREISAHETALACRCGHCGASGEAADQDDESGSGSTADDDADAAAAARSMRRYRRRRVDTDTPGVPAEGPTISVIDAAQTTSEVLRSVKNLVRYANAVRMSSRNSNVSADGDLQRLRSVGMLRVYQEVLVGCSCPEVVAGDAAARDDAARNASLALFHVGYGTAAANPAATRARTALVEELGFVPILMDLLGRGTACSTGSAASGGDFEEGDHDAPQPRLVFPPPLLLSLTRHVHSLVGCDPRVVPVMDRACRSLGDTGLVSVLVSILTASVLGGDGDDDGGNTTTSSFPGTEASDRRPDLATEILRVLFALRATGAVPDPSSAPKDIGDDDTSSSAAVDFDSMTRIGQIVCHILKLPPTDRSLSSKLAAVNLLMDAPKGYASYLLNEGAVSSLLLIFRYQIDEVIERRTGSFNADAATLVPILAVLDRLSADDSAVQQLVKSEVFPPSEEEAYQARAAEERAKGGGGRNGLNAKNMQPALEATKGTLRWKLIRLMTWPESNVKRCVSELLWRLCDCDATEFVLRVGFGNAVHMLGIKGLVQVPSSSFG